MENLSAKQEKLKLLRKLIEEIFCVSLILYFLLYFLETLYNDFVTNFFNLNILAWISLILGVASVIFPSPQETVGLKENKKIWLGIFALSFATALIIGYKSRGLGLFSYVLAALTFVITFIIIRNIFKGEDKAKNL